MSRTITVGDVLNRLSERGCRPKGAGNGQWSARCPAHNDRNPSLSVGEGDEGRILLECHAGCDTADVCAALDLTIADLAGPSSGDDWTPYGPAVASYSYEDEGGRELFTVHRTADKQFPCSRPDASAKSGRRWKLGDTRRVLYRLPRVLEAVKAGETIHVVEGEKDVHAVERAGAAATCNPGGAGKWRHRHATPPYRDTLAGARVVIVADRDTAGGEHARIVAADLRSVADVTITQPVEGKKDVADHLAAGHTLDELVPWAPSDEPTSDAPQGAPEIRLLTIKELADLKPPTWRIEQIMPDACFTTIFGVQSTYKSFVALDWGLSIAAGIPWLGHDTTEGVAVYVAAEGGTGLAKRITAWSVVRDHEPERLAANFRAIPRIVNLRDPATVDELHRALIDQLDAAPDLLVVDTWSRSIPGGNENAAEEVSAAIDRLDRIRADLECGVLIVHHAGIETGRERGSSSLPYAMDCRWETDGKPNAESIVFRCHKQKDWEASPPIRLRRHVVGEGDESSLILQLDGDPCSRHRPVVAALDGTGPLTQNKLVMLLVGTKATCIKDAQDAAACPVCPVESWQGNGRKVMYGRSDQNAVQL